MSKAIRATLPTLLALAWLCVSVLGQGGVANSTKNPKQIAILHWYPINLTTNFAVGAINQGVLFDGTNLWVTTTFDTVIKVRPSDGHILGTFGPFSAGAGSMAFDGANVWITTSGNNILEKVRASDGALIGQFGGGGSSILFDGANIWWTNGNRISNLAKVRPSD